MARGYRDKPGNRGPTVPAPAPRPPRGPRLHGDQVQVDGYSAGWLDRGFPWVYAKEIVGGGSGRAAGETVQLLGPDGQARGAGLWATDGTVAVRRFRRDPGPVDLALVQARVEAARARRVLPPDTTAWRWIHGENDDLPGLRIDVWGQQLAIALDSPSLSPLLPLLVQALVQSPGMEGLRAIWRVDRPEEPTAAPGGRLLWGQDPPEEEEVLERGLRYRVRPGRSHDVGLFCDMRELRAWLQPQLAGRRVLNLFAHTGAFSVLAGASGAERIVTVDLSPHYLERFARNLACNGLSQEGHEILVEDSFAALDRFRRKGEQFDLVIADPPSFSHGPRGDWSVTQDLGRLVAACCRVLSPRGWLLVASNHGGLSPKDFGRLVIQGSLKAEVPLRILHEGCPPPDFPAALDFPESRYLKAWVLAR